MASGPTKKQFIFSDGRVRSRATYFRQRAKLNSERAAQMQSKLNALAEMQLLASELTSSVKIGPDSRPTEDELSSPIVYAPLTSALALTQPLSMPASQPVSPTQSNPPSPEPSKLLEISEHPSLSSEHKSTNTCLENNDSNIINIQKNEIQFVFSKHGLTLEAQADLLRIMRNLKPYTQESLPKDGRSLRPATVPYVLRETAPGDVVYFGISRILNMPGVSLFNRSATTIHLSVNIDGLPLFKSSGVGLWPILGSIEQQQVFIIGLYAGKHKPICSNEFLKMFVDEVCDLRTRGICIDGKTYRFVLKNLLMDAPARAYILGVTGHAGASSCTKCHVKAVQIQRRGLASTLAQRTQSRKALCFLNLDAPRRQGTDFVVHFDSVPDEHHLPPVSNPSIGGVGDNDDDEDDLDIEPTLQPVTQDHHRHPTILSKIPDLDLVKDVPLDYMHTVLIGVMKKLLKLWLHSRSVLPPRNREKISKRLLIARKYCPEEFQRKPESLMELSSWKATQFRVFLLYIGIPVLHGLINEAYLNHFAHLVVAIRCLTRKVPNNENRSHILLEVGEMARMHLRTFVEDGVRLFGPEFAVYNVHSLIHAPDDYIRFGPLDGYSCFKYESFLGHLKKYVRSGYQPLQQVITQYSNLLKTKQFANEDSEPWDHMAEYFDMPVLKMRVANGNNQTDTQNDNTGRNFDRYQKLCFKNFVLRCDNDRDSCCIVNNDQYMRITEIIRDNSSEEIFVRGKCFQSVNSMFSNPCESRNMGMVFCSNLTDYTYTYPLHLLREKCFAFPLRDERTVIGEWAVI